METCIYVCLIGTSSFEYKLTGVKNLAAWLSSVTTKKQHRRRRRSSKCLQMQIVGSIWYVFYP